MCSALGNSFPASRLLLGLPEGTSRGQNDLPKVNPVLFMRLPQPEIILASISSKSSSLRALYTFCLLSLLVFVLQLSLSQLCSHSDL